MNARTFFDGGQRTDIGVSASRTHYVPSRDGQRFLVNTQTSDPAPTPITS